MYLLEHSSLSGEENPAAVGPTLAAVGAVPLAERRIAAAGSAARLLAGGICGLWATSVLQCPWGGLGFFAKQKSVL